MRAHVKIDLDRQLGHLDRNIYGQFMCRRPGCSEGGLYAPDSPTADEYGLRSDVVAAMQDLCPPLIRWPGGCTGTSYRWMDGVGPIDERPKNIDLHFGWLAEYGFGTHEFVEFCRRIGAEPHLNFAMGTGTLDEAAAWVEYCNGTLDSTYANLRRQHGQEEPYGVKYWQLGNEMYGPWEIGHTTPQAYGAEAREWAKVLRRIDPTISIIAVGGGAHVVPEWAWEVVPQVGPYADYISIHDYWRSDGEPESWYQLMAGPHGTEEAIRALSAIIRVNRRRNPLARSLSIAITEWNAAPTGGMMTHHPELHPFEPTYRLGDALAVASFINVMQRHCRDVRLATIAQSINVVGLIMVTDEGVWREPVYWPLWMQAHHSGPVALDAWVACDTFDSSTDMPPLPPAVFESTGIRPAPPLADLPYLDCSATLDPAQRKLFLSMVNRHLDDAIQVDVAIPEARVASEGLAHILHHDDPNAMNTPADPEQIKPQSQAVDGLGSRFTWELKPHSYAILELSVV